MGPTLLDLEILTGGTTDQISFSLINGSVSGLIGALAAGISISVSLFYPTGLTKSNEWDTIFSHVFC